MTTIPRSEQIAPGTTTARAGATPATTTTTPPATVLASSSPAVKEDSLTLTPDRMAQLLANPPQLKEKLLKVLTKITPDTSSSSEVITEWGDLRNNLLGAPELLSNPHNLAVLLDALSDLRPQLPKAVNILLIQVLLGNALQQKHEPAIVNTILKWAIVVRAELDEGSPFRGPFQSSLLAKNSKHWRKVNHGGRWFGWASDAATNVVSMLGGWAKSGQGALKASGVGRDVDNLNDAVKAAEASKKSLIPIFNQFDQDLDNARKALAAQKARLAQLQRNTVDPKLSKSVRDANADLAAAQSEEISKTEKTIRTVTGKLKDIEREGKRFNEIIGSRGQRLDRIKQVGRFERLLGWATTAKGALSTAGQLVGIGSEGAVEDYEHFKKGPSIWSHVGNVFKYIGLGTLAAGAVVTAPAWVPVLGGATLLGAGAAATVGTIGLGVSLYSDFTNGNLPFLKSDLIKNTAPEMLQWASQRSYPYGDTLGFKFNELQTTLTAYQAGEPLGSAANPATASPNNPGALANNPNAPASEGTPLQNDPAFATADPSQVFYFS